MAFRCSTQFSFERLEATRLENLICNLCPEGRPAQFPELLSGLYFSSCMSSNIQFLFVDVLVLWQQHKVQQNVCTGIKSLTCNSAKFAIILLANKTSYVSTKTNSNHVHRVKRSSTHLSGEKKHQSQSHTELMEQKPIGLFSFHFFSVL